ncbi:MAG TPA: hypothetical protein VHX37_04045 [Acidobacteriaceae bacterium]|jgi:cytochrome c-type biogenesis protein CcmH/NrfF|nr:hypothetical protein [Acidobacteriaceae bacterium]
MQLPPFTARSVLLYLIGVVALLLLVYMLILMTVRARPHKSVPLQPGAHAAALRLDRV